MKQVKISEVHVNLWGGTNEVSFLPHPDVNIIVGINGSGKTTMLFELEKALSKKPETKGSFIYIPSVDNLATRDNRKKGTALSQDLDSYIYDMKTGPSLMYYRMSMLDATTAQESKVKRRIREFCGVVNDLFKDTEKNIEIEGNKFIIKKNDTLLSPNDLSSGEKQMLLILLRVFLLDERDSVVLIDEPENSLDISWQYKLIDLLVRLNPNAQFFITTHSPSIFGDGWGDKIFYMEDITSKIEKS